MSDAAHWILTQDNAAVTGRCFVDEDVLVEEMGLDPKELSRYQKSSWMPLLPDLYVGDVEAMEYYLNKAKWVRSLAKGSFLGSKKRKK